MIPSLTESDSPYFNKSLRRFAATLKTGFGLIKANRLPHFLYPGKTPRDLYETSQALLSWIELAFKSGNVGGGISSGYDLQKGWGGPYPEITGYLIPTLLRSADQFKHTHLQALALTAGEWLLKIRLTNGAICQKEWTPQNQRPSVFNTAQTIRGWCALFLLNGDTLWCDAAIQSGNWIVDQQEADGSWARFSYNGIPHSYYAYVAWPLALLGNISRKERLIESARKHLDWILSQRDSDGWYKKSGFGFDGTATTHSIAYILEGLFESGSVLGEPRYIAASEEGAATLLKIYSHRGYIPGCFNSAWKSKEKWRCLTGDAQIGLLWTKVARHSGNIRFHDAAQKIADDLRKTLVVTPAWPEISGALKGSHPHWGDYGPYRYPAHAAKFMLDLIIELST